ncbi:MAG: hypothetical protein GX121_02270 [Ignavibacteria bacterium]|jgi:hypothetical protein|nr:hypothetical protein [Ignavibacteria bacterium]
MEKNGYIEFKLIGKIGNNELSPDNFDIRDISSLLQNVEDLLFPGDKKDRPKITYRIDEGSVKHTFKTSMQLVIAFTAIIKKIYEMQSIDFLLSKSARAFENLQNYSIQKYCEWLIKTSLQDSIQLQITPNTKYFRTESIWVDAEFYFYGILKDAGGKSKANIHLDTEDYGYLTIGTGEDFLRGREENLLYKPYGVRAIGKQSVETGELDTKSLRLLELIEYNPKFDKEYIDGLIAKASKNWKGIDVDEWLYELRGDYEL